jgi:hypothetical protein
VIVEFDVFGRRVLVERTPEGWRALYPGPEGKRRTATDLVIPPEMAEEQLGGYLADLCHEWATPEHSEVRRRIVPDSGARVRTGEASGD